MRKNLVFVCLAILLAMTLITSCDNSNTTPSSRGIALAVDEEGLINALEAGKDVILFKDVTLSDPLTISSSTQINLQGRTLTINDIKIKTSGDSNTEVVFRNGKIQRTSQNINIFSPTIAAYDNTKLVLDGVELSTNQTGLMVADCNKNVTIEVLNSKITAALYGISTNASKPTSDNIKIKISNSEITTKSSDGDNTGVLFNVKGSVEIENSVITGDRQALILRGGEGHKITNSTLVVTGNNSKTKEYTGGNWGSGNEVPLASLVIGNRSSSAYKYNTSVVLNNVTINNPDIEKYYSIYVYQNDTTNTVSVSGTLSSTSQNKVNTEKNSADYSVTGGTN
ncbi:hypothetical protein FYJ80_08710 [Spirochaetales bacterium NM-380-WT-3C1]|uniref:Uncharacterized protein n=1 Tax=Bullifex porci TaxID=2606638 RepID=A0A7X2PDC8_9SPIO|nr:hypothetical protein [Bullifex porci]MSU06849.1 hypothetical protein [Bullifex porci]